MITRDELLSLPERHRQLERDKEHLLYLREKATSIPSTTYGDKVQTSHENHAGIWVDAATDLAKEVRAAQAEFDALISEATAWIDSLDGQGRRLMRYRYIDCQTWDMTACLMGYTERHTRRMARKIVSELA